MARRDRNGQLHGQYTDRVQARNPITGNWVKIDTSSGRILGHKSTPGPYKHTKRK